MKNFSLSTLIDSFFTLIFGFVFSCLLLNYFFEPIYSLIISASLAILLSLFVAKISYSSYKKRKQKDYTARLIKSTLNELDFLSSSSLFNLFFKAYSDDLKNPEKRKNAIFLPQDNLLVVLLFGFKPTTKVEIVKAFNALNEGEKAVILSTEFTKEIKDFSLRFGNRLTLLESEEVYKILKKHDNLPDTVLLLPEATATKKFHTPKIFYKKNAKRFLGFGVMFLFMSYFVPLKIYYLICSGIMLIFGLILTLFGKQQIND